MMKGQGLPQGLVGTHFANGKAKQEMGSPGLESCLAASFKGEQTALLTDDVAARTAGKCGCGHFFFFFFLLVNRRLEATPSKAATVLDQKRSLIGGSR